MRTFALIALMGLAACSDQEVGQSTYFDGPYVANASQQPHLQAQAAEVAALKAQIAERQAQLAAERQQQVRQTALVASLETAIANADQQTDGSAAATMPSVLPEQVSVADAVQAAPKQAAPQVVVGSDGTISDNSFSTVTAQQSIESDAERLAALQQNTVVLEAEPLPARNDGVNLAAFARATTHKVGERVYRRSGSRSGSAARTCRQFGNPDEAQRAFLSKGGPDRDTLGIDPDGDGFVCGWTPEPFRNLRVLGDQSG